MIKAGIIGATGCRWSGAGRLLLQRRGCWKSYGTVPEVMWAKISNLYIETRHTLLNEPDARTLTYLKLAEITDVIFTATRRGLHIAHPR